MLLTEAVAANALTIESRKRAVMAAPAGGPIPDPLNSISKMLLILVGVMAAVRTCVPSLFCGMELSWGITVGNPAEPPFRIDRIC